MQFNSESNNQDCVSEINSICDSDNNSYTIKDKTRRFNSALEDVVGKLIVVTAGDKWHFGDSNLTALPTGLVTLVNSQEQYQLLGSQISGGTGVSTTTPLLNFLGASIKDNSGIWHVLKPISLWKDLLNEDIDPAEHFKTDGRPQYYELREDFLVLYPAPDNGVTVTLTSGLKVFYQRSASLFTVSDTTKVPGIPSIYHPLLCYKASLPYCISYKKDRVAGVMSEINRQEKEMLDFYSQRRQDEGQRRMIVGINSNK